MTAHSPKLILPFTLETAIQKVRIAEDNWNSGNPQQVALAYTIDSKWRNRAEFITGREEIVQFLTRKWNRALEYRLIKGMASLVLIGASEGVKPLDRPFTISSRWPDPSPEPISLM
jgi:nuclear transport factor 2 (NTF2) superfamily protein